MIQRQRVSENVLGNNIWKLPYKIFLLVCTELLPGVCRGEGFFKGTLFACSLFSPHKKKKKITTASGVKLLGNCCALTPSPSAFQDITPKTWGKETFRNRQEMCKIMRGFYTRTITINRAMGYIASGEHRKWTSRILSISTTVPKPKIETRRNISGPLSHHRCILPWSLTTINYQPSSTLGCACCTSQPFYSESWQI